jgi:hypothetical protein
VRCQYRRNIEHQMSGDRVLVPALVNKHKFRLTDLPLNLKEARFFHKWQIRLQSKFNSLNVNLLFLDSQNTNTWRRPLVVFDVDCLQFAIFWLFGVRELKFFE